MSNKQKHINKPTSNDVEARGIVPLQQNTAITLIALLITIIILLILTGVTITGLSGEKGVVARAQQAIIENKKAQYFEEINFAILEEKIERTKIKKTESFIVGIKKRLEGTNEIEGKEWISSIIICDENLIEQENDFDNTLLIVTTKEEYEIYIDINNSDLTAAIRDTFEKAEKTCIIQYDANGGSGIVESQSQKKGFSIILKDNEFTRTNYTFVGWCKNKDGTGDKYASGSSLKIEEDIILYAIWSKDTIIISYNANGGTGTMNSQEIAKGESTALRKNTFTKIGYYFAGWDTSSNGQTVVYTDEQDVTISNDQVLYAVWKSFSGYSVITASGIMISNSLSSDALPNTAYNNDYTNYAKLNRGKNLYLMVESSAYNKTLTLNSYINGAGDIAIYFYNSAGTSISRHLFYSSGKDTSSWATDEKTLVGSMVVLNLNIEIPANTYKIGVQKWDTGTNAWIYNMSVK